MKKNEINGLMETQPETECGSLAMLLSKGFRLHPKVQYQPRLDFFHFLLQAEQYQKKNRKMLVILILFVIIIVLIIILFGTKF